jgi:hemerythrin superfamily protein
MGACKEGTMPVTKKQDPAADVRRIHSTISSALEDALVHSQRFAQAGFRDVKDRQALVNYMRCFAQMLREHHRSEEEYVFPYIQEHVPDAPFDVLVAHHVEMRSLLDEIQNACGVLSASECGPETAQSLHDTLSHLSVLWHPHIALEEAQFAETMVTAWDKKEVAEFTRNVSEYMEQLIDPEELQACQAILTAAR